MIPPFCCDNHDIIAQKLPNRKPFCAGWFPSRLRDGIIKKEPATEKENAMFKKNDIIPLTIESITNEGSGIGHTDGIAVFVPMTAAGDGLRVRS